MKKHFRPAVIRTAGIIRWAGTVAVAAVLAVSASACKESGSYDPDHPWIFRTDTDGPGAWTADSAPQDDIDTESRGSEIEDDAEQTDEAGGGRASTTAVRDTDLTQTDDSDDGSSTAAQSEHTAVPTEGSPSDTEDPAAVSGGLPVSGTGRQVMLDGHLYYDTGMVSSVGRCGVMDWTIESSVSPDETPSADLQSNFGSGYQGQWATEGFCLIDIDGTDEIFATEEAIAAGEMPLLTGHFTAEVLEIQPGSILVRAVTEKLGSVSVGSEAWIFTAGAQMLCEPAEGDLITIWFNGIVLESYPLQIPGVYRIEPGTQP